LGFGRDAPVWGGYLILVIPTPQSVRILNKFRIEEPSGPGIKKSRFKEPSGSGYFKNFEELQGSIKELAKSQWVWADI
jgi:hypothetical protein